jgi:hypothetical protein
MLADAQGHMNTMGCKAVVISSALTHIASYKGFLIVDENYDYSGLKYKSMVSGD